MIDLSISIVSYRDLDKIQTLLSCIRTQLTDCTYHIYLVDNDTNHWKTAEYYEAHPSDDLTVMRSVNLGFGHGHNHAIEESTAPYHAVINPDITMDQNALGALRRVLIDHPEYAMVAPRILSPDGSDQQLPKRSPTFRYLVLGRLSRYFKCFRKYREEYTMANAVFDRPTELEFLSGCFLVMSTEAFRRIGGFDEDYFLYLEDADLTARMRKVGKTVFCPDITVTHHWQYGSSKSLRLLFIHIRSMWIYLRKKRRAEKRARLAAKHQKKK